MTKLLTFIGIVVLFISCGTPKELAQNSMEASSLLAENNFSGALEKIETVIGYYESKGKSAPDTSYALAGNIALKASESMKATQYLEKAIELGNRSETTYFDLTEGYQSINNLSKEIDALETFTDSFPESELLFPVKKRLMRTYIESDNLEKADALWENLGSEKQNDKDLLEDYVTLLKKQEKDAEAYKNSTLLLALDYKNTLALETISKHYYELAENRYSREMAAYEKNRTRKQYVYLLDQLKIATKDFKTSRTYFEQLYKLEPKKEYALYLANINARLNNKKQAEFYRNKAEQ